ncbi:hypothetical protein B0I33_10395 [Prauserella shujinwangii]|uniref:PPE family protein n=1 Tax=Prauserella shujinwangii TaxID=1453103 RepID=A0A2T0LYD0_9PSEU|nr:hypothetical protein [Prauserella shujinwangii]PRX49062.1 hypothetical protein B0I33_10395 [Prauserella shujinwangii]
MTLFMSGEDIYRNFKSGRGTEPLQAIAKELARLNETYRERAQSIKAIQDRMSAAWTGDAGAAASEGAGPLMLALEESAGNMDRTTGATMDQSAAWHDAANSVEPVPPMPEKPNPWTTGLKAAIPVAGPFMAADDIDSYQEGAAAHQRAAQHNVDVMNSYANRTSGNSDFPRTYGVLEPGGASISVTSSTPSAISGDTSAVPEATGASRYAGVPQTNVATGGPVGTGPHVGPATGAVPGGGPVNPGPVVSSGPNAGGAPQVPAGPPPASTSTTGTAGGMVTPGGGGQTSNSGRNVPSRTGFAKPTPATGTRGGSGGSGPRVGGLGERAGSRLYGQGGGTAGGRGAGGEGAGGRAAGESPRGLAGARGSGAGLPGGAAAADSAATRGAAGARGAGGMAPVGAGAGRGRGDEDEEHQRPTYLQENDPDAVFIGELDKTTPPVIGE